MSADDGRSSIDIQVAKKTASYLEDKEVEKFVREALKRYVKQHFEVVQTKLSDKSHKQESVTWTIPIDLKDPVLASLLASYVGLTSQEKQGRTNFNLQILIALVAVASLIASVVSILFRRS
jgi:hypothetical protein